MKRPLIALAGALTLVATLGAASGAQAATQATTRAAAEAVTHAAPQPHYVMVKRSAVERGAVKGSASQAQTCYDLVDLGNSTFSYVPGSGNFNLYFDTSGNASYFCYEDIFDGLGEMVDANNGRCLALNSTAKDIDEDSVTACGQENSWDLWLPIEVATDGSYAVWALQNAYNDDCMYDNTQRPTVYASCASDLTDHFEWFLWPSA
jgi:hypothetical protein